MSNRENVGGVGGGRKDRGTRALEEWCRRAVVGYKGVNIRNMTTSWRDGLAFCALIHHFRPDLIDFDSLSADDILENNALAFETAERHLGIPALLDAEDMLHCPVPDRLSVLTYVAQLYRAFAQPANTSPLSTVKSPQSVLSTPTTPNNRLTPLKPVSSSTPPISRDRLIGTTLLGKSTPARPPPPRSHLHLDSLQISPRGLDQGPPPSKVFAPRREPCAECGMPVFIAERLRIPHLPRTERGEEDSGGGNSSPPSQQSFLLMHRTCFRCARCRTQLSPAGGYYETESGAFCCEVCPDEEPASPVHRPARNSHGDPEGTLAVQTDEESEPEDHSEAAVGSNMDSYSEDFESALEASGGVGDSSPVHTAIPDGASSSLDGIQLPCNVQASDGAISLNAKSSSSNSSYLSFKSHPESSPITKCINEVISEERAEADGQKKLSGSKSESKEPESQHYKSDVSQFVQRLRPTNVIEKGDEDGVKALGKEVSSSKEEVSGKSNRPFSVVDRVRMFEREVKVRQSLPKDNKPVVVKEMDQNVRETVSVPAKKEAAIDAVGSLSVSETSVTTSMGSKYIPKEESKGAPEVKESSLKKSIEDIPYMDENGETSLNEEITEIPVKDTINLEDEEQQLDIPIEEKMEVVNKEKISEFPHQEQPPQCKEEVISLPREEAATGSGENANASLLESIDAAKSEGSMQLKSVVNSLEVKTEKIGDVDEEKPSEESVKLEEDEKEEVIAEDKKEEAAVEEFAVVDKVVLKSKLENEPSDSITVVIDSPKEEASASKLEGKKIKVYPKPSDKINYPVDLNPFGDEDEEEESKAAQVVKKKIIPVSLNPFGSSDEEEEEEVVLRKKIPVPAIRKSLNALDTVGRSKRHSSEERTNPFWSAGEDDDDDGFPREKTRRKSQSNVSDADRPVPKPRTVWNSATSTPEPSPKPRRDASPCKSAESTLTRRRKKKPAPPPPLPTTPQPVPRSSTPTPLPSADVSITSSPSVSTTTSPGGTPRRPRKSRPAPPRPGDSPAQPRPSSPPWPESPSSSRDIVSLLPVSPSQDEDAADTTSTKEDSDVNVPPLSPSHSKRPLPESEKRQKDAENRNRRSRTSGGEEEEMQKEEVVPVVNERPPDKSTFGQWKRKKGPAPPRPLPPKRKINPHVPMSEIRRELCDIEVQQMELERQGVALERAIRARFQQEDSPNDAWIPAEVEAQVLQLFELVNEKNELFRRQAELMYMRRQLRLEEEHADLEFQIRCLMERPASLKTDADKEREEMLIQRLVEVVEARDEVVQCLESDRLREAQEDVTVRARLAGAFPGKAAEKGEEEDDLEQETSLSEKGKKSKKDKKVWERVKKKVVGKKGSGGVLHLGKGKRKKDADKDVDEVEEEGRRKEGGAW